MTFVVATILHVLGSLGLLVYGMRLLSEGVQRAAGARLQSVLNHLTTNRFAAIATGFLVTVLVQSSSATTVMVVSFVNASLLTLAQAIGAIMGANIGTTVTGWIIALLGFSFRISALALPAVGVGAFLIFNDRIRKPDVGEAFIGFGLLFLGLGFLRDAVPNVGAYPEVLQQIASLSNAGILSVLFFVAVGTILTILVQSSSAAMTITLTMAYAGWIDFSASAAIILGENIGTTVTANLAAMGGSRNGKRAARAHLLFNVVGVLWMIPLLPLVLRGIDAAAPGVLLPTRLALFHTTFNVVNTLIFVGFVPALANLVRRLVPDPTSTGSSDAPWLATDGVYELPIPPYSIGRPAQLYLLEIRYEVAKMGSIIESMITDSWTILRQPPKGAVLDDLRVREEYTDQMQEAITEALASLSLNASRDTANSSVRALLRIVEEFEHIADSAYNVALIAERRHRKKIKISDEAMRELEPYTSLVRDFVSFVVARISNVETPDALERAGELEDRVNRMRNELKKSARRRIQQGAALKGELTVIDLVGHFEHIGDYALNVAQATRHMRMRTALPTALPTGPIRSR